MDVIDEEEERSSSAGSLVLEHNQKVGWRRRRLRLGLRISGDDGLGFLLRLI